MNDPSPYFFRRTVPPPGEETIDLNDYVEVEDQKVALREYWLIIKRHRWLILICGLVFFIGTALYTFTRTPLYTAQATLLIERKPPQVLKVQDALSESIEYNEYFKTQYEILKSRALAERVIRDEGLQSQDLFAGGKKGEKPGFVAGLWSDVKGWVAGLFDQLGSKIKDAAPAGVEREPISAYLGMLEIKPVRGTSLVEVVFNTPEPALSARLANAHASSYVRYGIDVRSQTNEEALVFLQSKLQELKERVEKSEAALNSYRREKGIISVDDKENVIVDRWVDLNKMVTTAEADRIGLEAQVRTIRSRNYDALPVVINSSVIQGLKSELAKSQAEYSSLSKEFKPGYPPLDNLKARMDDTRRRLQAEIQNEIKGVESAYLAAKTREDQLRSRLQEQKQTTLNLKDSAVQYAILAREVDTNRQLYDSVLQRMKEMGVAAEVRTSNVYVMEKAEPPRSPSYPKKSRSLLLGLLIGLSGGIGLAFLLVLLENTFQSPEEIERYIGLPNLSVVPDFAHLNNGSYGYIPRLVSPANSASPPVPSGDSKNYIIPAHYSLSVVAEAYRMLRSSLLLSRAGEPPKTVLITSARRGEGKTTTLVNIAIVFAQMGVRTLIIDGDLRRPRVHRRLEVENGIGLSDLLTGQIDWQKAIKPTKTDNLFLMSSGPCPPNPAELLGSKIMGETLKSLREHYDYIFVDSSPVMAVSDAVLLSTMVEGVLLVVDGKTPKPLARKARVRLTNPHTKILGVLLNRVDTRQGDYANYYSHYYHYYQEDKTEEV